jgi:hypothetical protein
MVSTLYRTYLGTRIMPPLRTLCSTLTHPPTTHPSYTHLTLLVGVLETITEGKGDPAKDVLVELSEKRLPGRQGPQGMHARRDPAGC